MRRICTSSGSVGKNMIQPGQKPKNRFTCNRFTCPLPAYLKDALGLLITASFPPRIHLTATRAEHKTTTQERLFLGFSMTR